jgi:general L-amino acid transport system permease protein
MKIKTAYRRNGITSWALQISVLVILVGLIAWSLTTAWERMHAQGIAYGFGVLSRPTGWQITSPFLDQSPDDPYWWTLVVAFANTLGASLMSIVLASLTGLLVGVGLLAPNRVVAQIFRTYVEIFRNVPLVLQALFWYVTLTTLPTPRADPPSAFNAIFVTNQGLFLPTIRFHSAVLGWFWAAAVLGLLGYGVWRHSSSSRAQRAFARSALFASIVIAICLPAVLALFTKTYLHIESPKFTGFSFQGGWNIPLELIALVFATVLFSSAYIGEIVRGGLLSVPRGLIEAAQALGLSAGAVFSSVRFPVALRSMIPALGNIFLFIVKATAIGSAIGYADVYSVSVVSISQTGQAVEFLISMMVIYFALNYSLTLLMNALNRSIAFKGNR